MPRCTARYNVRLTPKVPGAWAMDVVAVFHELRAPDEWGEPGPLLWRRLETFSCPTGYEIKERVTREREWDMEIHERLNPLQWDS